MRYNGLTGCLKRTYGRMCVCGENDLYETALYNRLYNFKVTLEIETLSERSGLRVCRYLHLYLIRLVVFFLDLDVQIRAYVKVTPYTIPSARPFWQYFRIDKSPLYTHTHSPTYLHPSRRWLELYILSLLALAVKTRTRACAQIMMCILYSFIKRRHIRDDNNNNKIIYNVTYKYFSFLLIVITISQHAKKETASSPAPPLSPTSKEGCC